MFFQTALAHFGGVGGLLGVGFSLHGSQAIPEGQTGDR